MPHTYPSPALRRQDTKTPLPPTPFSNRIPARPALIPNNSRYLTPNQQAGILSWRSNTSTSAPSPTSVDHSSPPTTTQSGKNKDLSKVKSAPSSLNLLPLSSQCVCSGGSVCSCETHPSANSPNKGARGYYSNKKKKRSSTTETSTPGPVTPSFGHSVPSPIPHNTSTPAMQAYYAQSPSYPTGDKKAMHPPQNIHPYTAPHAQYGQAPIMPVPEGVVAMPPKDVPRIAGARDPISQN